MGRTRAVSSLSGGWGLGAGQLPHAYCSDKVTIINALISVISAPPPNSLEIREAISALSPAQKILGTALRMSCRRLLKVLFARANVIILDPRAHVSPRQRASFSTPKLFSSAHAVKRGLWGRECVLHWHAARAWVGTQHFPKCFRC